MELDYGNVVNIKIQQLLNDVELFLKKRMGIFIQEYQSAHLRHKYYTIEIERDKNRKYLKEQVQKSHNIYVIHPKDIYLTTKEEHPQFKIPFNKCKQLITYYLDAEKTPEPLTIDQIDLKNEIFKE